MARNGILDDVRAVRFLDEALRGPELVRQVGVLGALDKRRAVLELIESREIPRGIAQADLQQLAAEAGLPLAAVAEGRELERPAAISALLTIRPPSRIDPVARSAASGTRDAFGARLAALPNARKRLAERGVSATVEQVTQRLDAMQLEAGRRLVLSQPPVYELLFLDALDLGGVPDDDPAGVVDHVLRHIEDEALAHLLNGVVQAVLDDQSIVLPAADRDDVVRLALARGLDLTAGRLFTAVLDLVETRRRQGQVPRFVDHYLDTRQEIQDEVLDESLRQSMIEYLLELSLAMTFSRVVSGEFDEYFALAYDNARRRRTDSDDPIDRARSGARFDGRRFDFTIPSITERSESTARPEAVEAAAALYSIFVEGELLRLFDLADHLVLDWHRGALDVSDGVPAQQLNRYEHMRRERQDQDERGMLYRRIFNFGQAEVLSGTLLNQRFPERLDDLMYEVGRLLDLQDEASADRRQISRVGVLSAIGSLQDNLGQFVTGSAFIKIHEMKAHLLEARAIVTSDAVVSRYGGTDRTLIAAIKNMALGFLDESLPVEDLFQLADRGNEVLTFISRFERASFREEPFQNFLESARFTVIALAAVTDGDWQDLRAGSARRPSGGGRSRRRPGRNGDDRNGDDRNGDDRNGDGHDEGSRLRPVPDRDGTDDLDDWDR